MKILFNTYQSQISFKSLSVEKVKMSILSGLQRKEIAMKYNTTTGTLDHFIKKHKDEINYKELKNKATEKIVKRTTDAQDLSEKLNIKLKSAKKLRKQYLDEPLNFEQRREERLKTEIRLRRQGTSLHAIADEIGCSMATVKKDLDYYKSKLQNTAENQIDLI